MFGCLDVWKGGALAYICTRPVDPDELVGGGKGVVLEIAYGGGKVSKSH
jgi:hypothetical protein